MREIRNIIGSASTKIATYYVNITAPQSQLCCRTILEISQRKREQELCCNFAIISNCSWRNHVAVRIWKCQTSIQSEHVLVCVLTCAEQRVKCGRVRRIKWVQSVCLLLCMEEHFKKLLHFTHITVIKLALQKCWNYYWVSVILYYRDGCGINGGLIFY